MSDKLIIRKGEMEIINTDRSNLISVDQSHDGISFIFKNGIQVYATDNDMPIYTKDLIRNTTNSFPTANLTINLSNYNKPVLIEPTKK